MTKTDSRITTARRRVRKGSALILVLIMTLSLAGLAISAIYLSSSAGLLTRYYDRERDYRNSAEAALALGKSRLMNDTLLVLPQDTAMRLLTAATLTDASGATIPRIRVNLYGAYTGDTTGKYGQFVTLVAQAYDSGGTRHVRRLDLIAENFARYAMFTNLSPSNYQYGPGEFLRGRGHSNEGWNSSGPGGPHYYDTITAVTTVSGPATYDRGYREGVRPIPYPSIPKLGALPGYATTGNMNFDVVSGVSGGAKQGTWLNFVIVDANDNGDIAEAEGFFRLFDLTLGQDTTRLRADMDAHKNDAHAASRVAMTDSVLQNQCGASYTIAGRQQFFPVSMHRVAWVDSLIRQSSTNPVVTGPEIALMGAGTRNGMVAIMSQPGGRCYPAGDPHLMLTERLTDTFGNWTQTAADSVPWGTLNITQRRGGEDTTFSPITRDCVVNQGNNLGRCVGGTAKELGRWRAWPGAAIPAIPVAVRQANETPYLWPMSLPTNPTSKGVIYTPGKLYVSGVFRGDLTLYVANDLVWIDDLVYDEDPAAPAMLCRNMLGIITQDSMMLGDNAINRPRQLDNGPALTRFMGPNQDFILHAILLTVNAQSTVTTENADGNTPLTPTAVDCFRGSGFGTSGGCWLQTGGTIQQKVSLHYTSSANSGLREGRTLDPCQLTNKRPAFFPSTMTFQDNKYFEIDPVVADTWTEVKAYYARLRGRVTP